MQRTGYCALQNHTFTIFTCVGMLVTVQLVFRGGEDMTTEDTPMWRSMLDGALQRALADVCTFYFFFLLLRPWLFPSSGVAGTAVYLLPPCCPLCCVVLFRSCLCHISLTRFFPSYVWPPYSFPLVCPYLAFLSLCAPLSSSSHGHNT